VEAILIRKAQPTAGDVHVNQPLANISVAYFQEQMNFVADQVFPNIPVQKQSNVYYVIPRGAFNRDQMSKRAPGTETKGIGYDMDTDNYHCDTYGLHHPIPDAIKANYDSPLSADREATELLTHAGLIRREVNWVSSFFITGLWTTERAGVASGPTGTQFLRWDEASSTPIADIEGGKVTVQELTGREPNTLVIDRWTLKGLKENAEILDRLKYGQTAPNPAMVTLNILAQIFGLERVLVSQAIVNTAVEGAADSHSFIAGKNALLCYVPRNPGLYTPSAGYTFSWNGWLGAGAQGQRIRRYRVESKASEIVEIDMAFVQKQTGADLGAFFLDTVS